MNDQPTRQQRLAAEAATASAEAWAIWTADIGARLAALETKMVALVGDESGQVPGVGDPALFVIIGDFLDDERKERSAAIARITDALNERISAEVAVMDERWGERIDSKIFDLASIRKFKASVEKISRDMQTDLTESLAIADGRITELADRIVSSEKRRRNLAATVSGIEYRLKGLPAPPVVIKEWRVDLDNFVVTPKMSDGREGAPLDLFPLLRKLAEDLAEQSR